MIPTTQTQIPAAMLTKAFQAEDWRAVYVAGALDRTPLRFGDNLGGWPITIGIVRSYRDSVGSALDAHSPVYCMGMIERFWILGLEDAKRLETVFKKAVAPHTEPLRRSWRAFPGTMSVQDFPDLFRRIAEDKGFEVWTEAEFRLELEERARRMMRAEQRKLERAR